MIERDFDDGSRPERVLLTAGEKTTAAGLGVLAAFGVCAFILGSVLGLAVVSATAILACFAQMLETVQQRRQR